ncbi:MAG: adenylate/guanylate cyclase domain-containing protein [Reyranella sp.]|uniref:adenylate/guanylate cyclase domain-containing protein n=1 Tax=Reyranella sp. TaxID=1929291 RepID=UPI001AD1A58B|nr:adenylate/guanylate cyclase domain-containing protein [Reyranella sp.]MBN9085764.1 adenylate/guanylate cyclase domain-containing protein [Reyranella sp.]
MTELAGWLVEAGLRNLPFEEMVEGFARRLDQAGVPVARIFVATNTLHPQVLARSLIWDRASGFAQRFEFRQGEIDAPIMRESPFADMLRTGLFERRLDLRQPPAAGEAPVFAGLRGLGMTDWLGNVFPFGELAPGGSPRADRGVGQLWFLSSMATDRAGGFEEAHIAKLREILPMFALAAKAITMRAVQQGLLESYLGADPAARVLAGTVRRGEVHAVEAVLLYADLRSFTPLADSLPGDQLITLLDGCFDCMVRPVNRHGGEVLKFLGDGLLAIFRLKEQRRAAICASALAAASEALDLMELYAAERLKEGKPTPGLDIALHVGAVQYGNVGTDARLDFTVIGPAVNEAARIEVLCKELGHPLLVSDAFAAAADDSRSHLVSLGQHRLRGVRDETELFTLAR